MVLPRQHPMGTPRSRPVGRESLLLTAPQPRTVRFLFLLVLTFLPLAPAGLGKMEPPGFSSPGNRRAAGERSCFAATACRVSAAPGSGDPARCARAAPPPRRPAGRRPGG